MNRSVAYLAVRLLRAAGPSDRTLDAPAAWVWTVRGGKAVRNMNYHDTNAWRQALGD